MKTEKAKKAFAKFISAVRMKSIDDDVSITDLLEGSPLTKEELSKFEPCESIDLEDIVALNENSNRFEKFRSKILEKVQNYLNKQKSLPNRNTDDIQQLLASLFDTFDGTTLTISPLPCASIDQYLGNKGNEIVNALNTIYNTISNQTITHDDIKVWTIENKVQSILQNKRILCISTQDVNYLFVWWTIHGFPGFHIRQYWNWTQCIGQNLKQKTPTLDWFTNRNFAFYGEENAENDHCGSGKIDDPGYILSWQQKWTSSKLSLASEGSWKKLSVISDMLHTLNQVQLDFARKDS